MNPPFPHSNLANFCRFSIGYNSAVWPPFWLPKVNFGILMTSPVPWDHFHKVLTNFKASKRHQKRRRPRSARFLRDLWILDFCRKYRGTRFVIWVRGQVETKEKKTSFKSHSRTVRKRENEQKLNRKASRRDWTLLFRTLNWQNFVDFQSATIRPSDLRFDFPRWFSESSWRALSPGTISTKFWPILRPLKGNRSGGARVPRAFFEIFEFWIFALKAGQTSLEGPLMISVDVKVVQFWH